jgi:uncharacterized protein with NAD-binding domain and iron-sulfur cluster
MIFRDGLLSDAHAGEVGFARVGLSRLVPDRAVEWLLARGAAVRSGERVTQIRLTPGGAAVAGVELAEGNTLEADAVICAVPATAVASLLPTPWHDDPWYADIAKLGTSPICNVHIGFDRPVMEDEFFALYDTPVHWVFNKGRILRTPDVDGAYLSCTTSAAGAATRSARDGVLATTLATLRRALPAARAAECVWSRVVVEPDATFAARPGTQRYRRPPAGPLRGCFLAGAWTDTGWPATMEGAVRSGEAAAAACLTGSTG